MNLEIDKLDAKWRHEKHSFSIGNSLPLKNLDTFSWTHTISLKTGKTRTNHSSDIKELSREDFKDFKKQLELTLKYKSIDFFNKFFNGLEYADRSLWLDKKKVSISGIKARKHNEFIVFPMHKSFKETKTICGMVFLNDSDGSTFEISTHEKGCIFLKGDDKKFFCLGLQDGFNCHNLNGASIGISISSKRFFESTKKYANEYYDTTIVAIGKNPNQKELENGAVTPIDFIKTFTNEFSSNLNVYVKFPPFFGIGTGVKSPETFYDYFKINPQHCEKKLNESYDFPNVRVLGAENGKLWVWSKYIDTPKELSDNSKFPSLLLIAKPEYYKEKFGTKNPKIIIEALFNIARGKNFHSHKIRSAGLWLDGKEKVINTGKKIIGTIDSENGFTYLKNGFFPTPTEEPIDSIQFLQLKENVMNNISYKSHLEGLSVFGWSILSLFAHIIPVRFSLHLYGDSSGGKNFTRDQVVLQLQDKFKNSIKNYLPGCTYAGFKDDLRCGVAVFHFDEAQGKTYDENITKIIRASTYSATEIKQMRGSGGGTVITPVSFMASSMFNFEPEGLTVADRNRIYDINYSFNRLIQEKKQETLKQLLALDLPKLGHQCFSHILHRWDDFLKEYAKAKNQLDLFGLTINGHKRAIFSELYAFYKVTGLLSNELLKEYSEFLAKKDSTESYGDYNSSYVDSISRILILDKAGFKKRTIKSLIEDVVSPAQNKENAGDWWDWSNWMRHASSTYQMKIIKPHSRAGLWLSMPTRDNFIISNLKRMGFSEPEACSYSAVLDSEFSFKTITRHDGGRRRSVCIPIEAIASSKALLKWNAFESHSLKALYV